MLFPIIGGASIEDSECLNGIEADRLIVFGNREIVLPLIDIRQAAANERVCERRLQSDRFSEISNGLIRVASRAIRRSPIIKGHGEGRIQPYRLRAVGDAEVVLLLLKIDAASIEDSARIVGIESDRFIVFGNRAIKVSVELVHVAANAVTGSTGWVEIGRFFIVAYRAVVLALVLVSHAAAVIGTCEVLACFVTGFDDAGARAQPLIQGGVTATGTPFPVL